jgi:hypothetical protein
LSNNKHDGIEFVFDPTGSESGAADTVHNHKVTLKGNVTNFNGNDGVEVESGSTRNRFTFNTMLSNANYEAEDLSIGSGIGHTGNIWKWNRW